MKFDTKNRALIAGLTLIIPLAALSMGVLGLGDLTRADNYSSYLLRDISENGNGAVVHWVDYSSGVGDIMIKGTDERGYFTGSSHRIHHEGKDSFLSSIGRVTDHLVVFYLTTVLDIEEARYQEETWVELNIKTLDPVTLEPAGKYSEGEVLGEFQVEYLFHDHFNSMGRMYAQYHMETLGFDLHDDIMISPVILDLDHYKDDGPSVELKNTTISRIEPDRMLLSIGEDLIPYVMLVEFRTRDFRMDSGNSPGTWGGLDVILYEEDDNGDLVFSTMNMGSMESSTWKLPGGLPHDDYRAVTDEERSVLMTEEYGIAIFEEGEENGTFLEFPRDTFFTEGRDIEVLEDGTIMAVWQGDVVGEVGDTMFMVHLDNMSNIVVDTALPEDVTYGRMVVLEDGSIIGIASSGGSSSFKLITFQLIGGDLVERESIASTLDMGIALIMVMAFAPFVIGFAAFIINISDMRLKQFRKMTESQLQLFDEKVLGKALGKRSAGMDKDAMIAEILKPDDMGSVSKKEERRRMRFVVIPFVYFALIGVGVIAIFSGLILDAPVKPAFFSGYSSVLEVFLLSFALSALIFLLLGEWGLGRRRNSALMLMMFSQATGQIFLLLFILTLFIPQIGYFGAVQFFMIMVPGLMFMGLFGPFLIILDRKKKKKMWAFLPMFAFYGVTTFILLSLMAASGSFVPTGTGRFISSMFFMEFTKLFNYMIVGMLGGAVIQSWISMNDIKPSARWSVKELMRMRTAPLIMAHIVNIALGIAFFAIGLGIPIDLTEGTLLMMITIFSAVVVGLGAVMYIAGIAMVKKLKKDTKNLNQGLMMAYFTPLITTITGLLLAMLLSVVGPILMTAAAAGQIFYADKVVRDTFQVLPFDIKKEEKRKMENDRLRTLEKKKQTGKKKTKMYLPEKLFNQKLKKSLRAYWILLLVMIVIGLLAAQYGQYLPQLELLKGLGPDLVYALLFVLVCAPLLIFIWIKMGKIREEESPMKLANAGIMTPLIVTTMLALLLIGALMSSPVIFLGVSAIYGIPYMITVRMYQDKAKKRFSELTREQRMVYPAEMVAFKAGAMGVTDQTVLERSPEEIKKDLLDRKGSEKKMEEKGEKKGDMDIPRKDSRNQIEKGEYLFMETPALQRARTSGVKKGGIIIIFLSASAFLLSLVGAVVGSICGIFTTVMMGVICLIFLPLGIVMLVAKGGKEPVKFYQWGAVDHSLVGAKEIYIPYGNLRPAGEKRVPEIGKIQLLKAHNISTIWLPTDRSPYAELHQRIQGYFANDDYQGYIENNAGTNAQDVVMPVVSLVLSVIGSIAIAAMMIFIQDLSLKMSLLAFASAFLILNLTLGNRSKKQENLEKTQRILRPKREGRDIKMTIMAISMVVGLLIAIAGAAVALLVPGGVMTIDIYSQDLPADYEQLIGFEDGGTYTIDSNLAVLNGQEARISNAVFMFEGSFSQPGMFYVENGGTALLDNVTLMSKGQSNIMSVEVHGYSEFTDCTFEGIWADSSMINGQGGVEVHGTDALFTNCTFMNASYNLLMVVDADVKLLSCSFMNCKDDAVEVQSSELEMIDCHVENVDWAMVSFDGSEVTIDGCRFNHTNYGIANAWSRLKVKDSSFNNIQYYAISSGFGSSLDQSGNQFNSVGEEVKSELGFEEMMFSTCVIIPFIIGILGLVYVVVVSRKMKKEAKKNGK